MDSFSTFLSVMNAGDSQAHLELEPIMRRIENERLKVMAEVNAAKDFVQDAAALMHEVRSELSRMVNLVESLESRLDDVESHLW